MDVKIYSREAIEVLLQNNFPANTAVISFYDPPSKRTPKDYHPVDYSGKCSRVFYVSVHDIDIEILDDYGLTFDTYFPQKDELAQFIYEAKKTVWILYVNVNTDKAEAQLVRLQLKNIFTKQVFGYLLITDIILTS